MKQFIISLLAVVLIIGGTIGAGWYYKDDIINYFKIESGQQAGSQGEQGPQGIPGENGADGQTPYIGANGNWWVGTTDTGISAQGPAGENGKDGQNGKDGENGIIDGFTLLGDFVYDHLTAQHWVSLPLEVMQGLAGKLCGVLWRETSGDSSFVSFIMSPVISEGLNNVRVTGLLLIGPNTTGMTLRYSTDLDSDWLPNPNSPGIYIDSISPNKQIVSLYVGN